MNEMIEKVARAIFKVSAPYHDDCCLHSADFDACPCNEIALVQARAAIEAMREPTGAMVDAGAYGSGEDSEHVARGAWEYMIDAALLDSGSLHKAKRIE